MNDPLLALAELRRISVDVDGHSVLVREFSAIEYAEYRSLLDSDKNKAVAFIIRTCVLNEDGTQRWNEKESLQVATGAHRVVARLVNAIHRLSGFGEKNE